MSGQGKSTLAASFARDGCPLVSDDCLVLREGQEGWVAIPSYPGVRLWPETAGELFDVPLPGSAVAHYTVKLRVGHPGLLPFAEAPCAVEGLYFLDGEETAAGEEVSIAPLAPHEAFMKLVNFTYTIDITDRELLKYQFDVIGRLTAQVRCYRLRYARGFPALPTVRQAILRHPREGESR